MSTGNYYLQIEWPNGHHSSAGTITDEQWGKVTAILAPQSALAASPAPEVPTAPCENHSTTSDRYRAELYDEVWQTARDMGYGNVTEALSALAGAKAQPAAQQGDEVRRLREALDAAEIAVSASESALRHLLHNIRASGKRVDLGLAPSSADEALRRIGQYKRTALSAQGEGERT